MRIAGEGLRLRIQKHIELIMEVMFFDLDGIRFSASLKKCVAEMTI